MKQPISRPYRSYRGFAVSQSLTVRWKSVMRHPHPLLEAICRIFTHSSQFLSRQRWPDGSKSVLRYRRRAITNKRTCQFIFQELCATRFSIAFQWHQC